MLLSGCTTLQCKMEDILHHVYFFSRKFGKNPKNKCVFVIQLKKNTLIIIVMATWRLQKSDTDSDSPASGSWEVFIKCSV